MLGFLRFEELSGGVLYAQMEPPYAVLPLIAPHFADRLRQENWIIHDLKRGLLALHRAGGWWVLTDDQELINMYRAADHRRAELVSGGRLFDLGQVPKSVWHYVQ